MLHKLLELASDHAAESRRRLLFAVTDLYLSNVTESREAVEDFSDIVAISVDEIADADKVAYAKRVAPETRLPADVAKKLARDPDAAVAALILRLSPVLSDEDLVAIARTHSPSHVLAITERAMLSPTVTDALIETGDDAAIRRLSANESAQFSERGMADLMNWAKADPAVLANLPKRRTGVSSEQANRLPVDTGGLHSGGGSTPPAGSPRREAQPRRLEVKHLLTDLETGTDPWTKSRLFSPTTTVPSISLG